MNEETILKQTEEHVKDILSGDGSGHDWWHICRVRKIAVQIAARENADLFVVQLAALLHDIADWKFNDGDFNAGPKLAREWLEKLQVGEDIIYQVCEIIKGVSFKGAGVKAKMSTTEGMIVQDADRLDAIGAIGIARTFAYGGHRGQEIYNPDVRPEWHDSFEEYLNCTGSTINHFYEKLLLLKDLMNTETARRMAVERHRYMEQFLERFYKEWDGKE
ncbi:MAG: HD domain-containing protein [Bacteroidales bacterium]|nr:HD domain-containing protein [Bacteroidales bacterium]